MVVSAAVDGVVDDGQLLSTNEPLVALLTCETFHVKHELLHAHHQFACRHCLTAFRTPRLRVAPVYVTLHNVASLTKMVRRY